MTFDEEAYRREVSRLPRGSDLVFGDQLFRVACNRKLTESPVIALTPEEIVGGLCSALYREPRSLPELQERFQISLPFLAQHLRQNDRDEPCSMGQMDLMGHVLAVAWILREVLAAEERGHTAALCRSWIDSYWNDEWVRQDQVLIHSSREWEKDADNPGLAGVGEAIALLEAWKEELPRALRGGR